MSKSKTYTLTGPDDVWDLPLADELKYVVAENFETVWNSRPGEGAHKIGLEDVREFASANGMELDLFHGRWYLNDTRPVKKLKEANPEPSDFIEALMLMTELELAVKQCFVMELDVHDEAWLYVPILWDLTFEGWKMHFSSRLAGKILNGGTAPNLNLTAVHQRLCPYTFYIEWGDSTRQVEDLGFDYSLESEAAGICKELIERLAGKYGVDVSID